MRLYAFSRPFRPHSVPDSVSLDSPGELTGLLHAASWRLMVVVLSLVRPPAVSYPCGAPTRAAMTELQRLELRVLELSASINLRPTLDRAAAIGGLLSEVRALLPHGAWLPWLKRVKLNDRSARNYMAVHREIGTISNRQLPADMTIKQFLHHLRNARINGKKAEREKVRATVAARLGTLPDSISLLNCDCRKMV